MRQTNANVGSEERIVCERGINESGAGKPPKVMPMVRKAITTRQISLAQTP